MSTAQIIYEQYKVLPKRVREELKALIINEENQEQPLTLMQEIEEGLKEVKPVSYTHLDVYKRQFIRWLSKRRVAYPQKMLFLNRLVDFRKQFFTLQFHCFKFDGRDFFSFRH